MTALPLARPSHDGHPALPARVRALEEHYLALWHRTPDQIPTGTVSVGRWRKLRNARRTRALISDLARRIEGYPSSEIAARQWRVEIRDRVSAYGEGCFDWPTGYRNLLVADEFWDSTVQFVRSAREFAPEISRDDLFQALRNVWIINSVQMLLDRPVECTRAAFAYSMLYPWTDNVLDAQEIDSSRKRDFNRRLRARLEGSDAPPMDAHQGEVFELVAIIERALPRALFPTAYESLLAIQTGQENSLEQHSGGRTAAELLEISIRKGGSSVLPDAYLTGASIAQDQERFLFGYGVFLQLLDDLQDVAEDTEAGHDTLMTAAAATGPLDRAAGRLANFVDACVNQRGAFSGPRYQDRKDLIRRNCRALLVGAVADQPDFFTPGFVDELERSWPLGFRRMRALRRFAGRRLAHSRDRLEAKRGARSPLDLLADLPA